MTVTVDTISALTSCTTALMLLSPIPDLYQMFKTRNCGHTSIIPLISIFGNSHMWMTYGFLDHNYSPLFSTFVLGDVFAIIYITIYYRATTERQYVGRLIGFVVGFLTLVTIYVVLAIYGVTHQTRKQLLQVVGYIGIAVSVVLFASPFEKALQVIRHRLAVFLSINLIVASTVNKGIWVVYTLVDLDWFLFAPNMLIFAFGLVQTALYFIFHPKTHPLILPQDEEVASKLERAESSPQSIKRSHSVEYICMLESPTVCIEPIHTI